MNQDNAPFSAALSQEFVPFDTTENNKYAVGALLGFPSIDPMEFFPDQFSSFDYPGFFDQYQVQADSFASPGALSPPSLPPSPMSSVGELSDLGVIDAPTPYTDLSPMGLSVLSPLANIDDVKPARADLEGFEYNPSSRKWVCAKCGGSFVSTHEARRHVKTAAKCTGTKVKCLRCGDHIHAAQWSRKRHFGSKKCQKRGRKRGTPTYTVNNGFEEL